MSEAGGGAQAALPYEVYAIRYSHREALRFEHFYERGDCGDSSMPIDFYIWLIRNAETGVVVDTGFTRERAEGTPYSYLSSPVDSLGALGVTAAEVGTVVLTHLHWDHIGNVDAFPRADFIVQEREMAFWCGPYAGRGQFARLSNTENLDYLVAADAQGRVQLVDGDRTIAPGISVHLVGGHTAGTQVVRVETAGGPVVLASDASHFYENIEGDRPHSIVHTLPMMYTAFDRVNELAGSPERVVAGHDPEVLTRFDAAAPEWEGLIVRIA